MNQGLDGEGAWAATNDRVQRLSSADAARMRRIATRYRPVRERPSDLRGRGRSARRLLRADVDRHPFADFAPLLALGDERDRYLV